MPRSCARRAPARLTQPMVTRSRMAENVLGALSMPRLSVDEMSRDGAMDQSPYDTREYRCAGTDDSSGRQRFVIAKRKILMELQLLNSRSKRISGAHLNPSLIKLENGLRCVLVRDTAAHIIPGTRAIFDD